MSKISIITINSNDSRGLRKTIESVINQTFSDFEYIVIDGDSSDGSKELLEIYKNKITYSISEPDSGIYNAMNKGIKIAKGEYLLFLNSGDSLLESSTLTKVANRLDGNAAIYYGDLVYFNKKKKKFEDWIFPNKLTLGFFVENSLPHQASFIKRTLFDSISLYNENLKIASDWEFFVIAICIERVPYKHIGIAVSEYDFSGISSNPENYELVYSEKKLTLDKYFPLIIDDYEVIKELKSRRVRGFLYIKKFSIPWKLLKIFSKMLLLFLPKQKNGINLF